MYKYMYILLKYNKFRKFSISKLIIFVLCLILSPEERYLNMELRIIKTKKQYKQCLNWVDVQFENKIKSNTPQGEKLQVALLLIKQYEDANYTIPVPDPIDAIKLKMKELELKNKDLVGKIGSKGYVSSLLNKKAINP